MIKKIVFIGPESTGKSTLCRDVALHYNAEWVKEYARAYLLKNGTNYTLPDLYTIAMGQLQDEDDMYNKLLQRKQSNEKVPLIIDTNLQVIKVWSEYVFNSCNNKILSQIANRPYHLYLLCNTDVPWYKDELREYPAVETRQKLFQYYKETLVEQAVPWVIITGTNFESRMQQAITAIDAILK